MFRWDICILCCIYLILMYVYFIYKCGWIKISQIKTWKKNAVVVAGQVLDVMVDREFLTLKPYTILKVKYSYEGVEYETLIDDRLLVHKEWLKKETIMLKIRKDSPMDCHYLYKNTNDRLSHVSFCVGFFIASCLCLAFLYVINLYHILKSFEFFSLEMYSVVLTLMVSMIIENILIENLITIVEPYQDSKYKGVIVK